MLRNAAGHGVCTLLCGYVACFALPQDICGLRAISPLLSSLLPVLIAEPAEFDVVLRITQGVQYVIA